MTGLKFTRFIRNQTKTNSTTFSDEELLLYANTVKDEIAYEIAKVNEDIFGMVAYRNLVADQREYSFPEYVLNNLKYFEVDTKGDSDTQTDPDLVTAQKHIRAEEFDLTQYERSTDEAEIRRMFQFRRVAYDIFRNALWLYTGDAIISVLNGLKLFYIRFPDDLTIANLADDNADLSNDLVHPISAGIPRQFHRIWATKVSVLYKSSKEKPIPLTEEERNVDAVFKSALEAISGMNLDRNQVATMPNYGYGENY